MKGLILKDLYCLKNQMKNLIAILFCFLILGITSQKNYGMITAIIPFYIVLLVISTFSYDDYNHFNTYCNTFPLTRKEIIKAKYILVLLSTLLSAGIGVILSYGISFFDKSVMFGSLLGSVLASIIGVCLVLAIMIPLLYKYGAQKGRIALFAIIIGISLLGGFIFQLLKTLHVDMQQFFLGINNLSVLGITLIGIVALFITMFISFQVSYHIYKKKEF